jgi:hypothetical protein
MKYNLFSLRHLRAVIGKDLNPGLSIWCVVVGLIASACMHDQRLAWQDTSQNEKGFRIYRVVGGEKRLIGEVGPNVTNFVDHGAPAGSCYVVTAFNDEGESPPTSIVCGKNG